MSCRYEEIGSAKLFLGDALDLAERFYGISALVSDPPFGMDFRSNHRNQKHRAIENDSDDRLLRWACEFPVEHSRYIFGRWDNLAHLPKPRSLVTWVKNNWSMGDLEHEHARQTEVIFFYPGEGHVFPTGRPSDVITSPRTGNNYHPTEKPVQLMEAIVRWTVGSVIDPFMGSGTTGVACALQGRSFVGIEKDEAYFDIACQRISDALARPRLFADPVQKSIQESLL